MSDPSPHPTVHINGTDLAVYEQGRGEPLLLIHGSASDYRVWEAQIAHFAEHYRTIAYSRRYHWPNVAPPDSTLYRATEHAADLIALLESRDLAPAHVVCESYGGVVALTAAVQRPDLFRTLVLAEPPLFDWLPSIPGGPEYLEGFLVTVHQPAGRAFATGNTGEGMRLFLEGVLGPGTWESFPQEVQEATMQNAPEMRAETNTPPEHFFPNLDPDDVAHLPMPVLLLEGEHSPPIFGAVAGELGRLLPSAERVTIPNASHVMHADNPDAYNTAVLGFLGRH